MATQQFPWSTGQTSSSSGQQYPWSTPPSPGFAPNQPNPSPLSQGLNALSGVGQATQNAYQNIQASPSNVTNSRTATVNGAPNAAASAFHTGAVTGGNTIGLQYQPGTSAVSGMANNNYGVNATGLASNLAPPPPIQDPGNNWTNPGYGEQALNYTQNRLLNDPSASTLNHIRQTTSQPSTGENFINQNLGSLSGPGQGDQQWNQTSGQYNSPFSGENFTRQAAQNMSPSGPASAFFNGAMQDASQFNNYGQPLNTQGQYGTSQQQLGGPMQSEQNIGQIAGNYAQNGTYQGGNNALGQYGANAQSGPLQSSSFYNQVAGQFPSMGQYNGPNLASGQYSQTQQNLQGLLPNANADAYYNRAVQLGTQDYDRQAAGRGVYGSSEALSGVGNVVTDLRAKQAQEAFGNQLSVAQESRAQQELLGNQARMGDLSSIAGFGANMTGLETFGNLANNADQNTINKQTMLGNQARQADQTGLDAMAQNTQAATAYSNINDQQGRLAIDRNTALGNMANQADTQGISAFRAGQEGEQILGNLANNADQNETSRFNATTGAMNTADQNQLRRLDSSNQQAQAVDTGNRQDFTAQANAADQSANAFNSRNTLQANIAQQLSTNDLNRLNAFNNQSQGAEQQRQGRLNSMVNQQTGLSTALAGVLGDSYDKLINADSATFENTWQSEVLPSLQSKGYSDQQIQMFHNSMQDFVNGVGSAKRSGTTPSPAPAPAPSLPAQR